MSKFTNHVKSDKAKWAITAIAFVLAFVMLAGVFMQVFLPEGKRPTDWFNKAEQEEQLPEEELPEENGGAIITEGTSAGGLKLMSASISPEDYDAYGVSPLAESAFSLTATVTPSDATWQDLQWDCKFLNAGSSWASGKNVAEYLSVPETKGNTINISCLQAFGEPIVITATSLANPSVSASCQVDYVKKITNFTMNSYNGTGAVTCVDADDVEFYIDITYSDGTITPETTVSLQAKVAIGYTTALDEIEFIHTECHSDVLYVVSDDTVVYTYSENLPEGNLDGYFFSDSGFASISWYQIIKSDCGCSSSKWGTSVVNQVKNIISSAFRSPANIAVWTMTYSSAYNGTTYSSGSASITQLYDGSDQAVAVTDITFDKSNIYI